MKKIKVCLILLVCVFASCNVNDDIATSESSIMENANSATTTKGVLSRQESHKTYSVSQVDVLKFLMTMRLKDNYQIEYYILNRDTLLYLVNHDKGWMMIAGDKRLNPIVAESKRGHMSFDSANENLKIWIDSYADEIFAIKNDTRELDNENTRLWASISQQSLRSKPTTRNNVEYKWAVVTSVVCDSDKYIINIPHLVNTNWGQLGPWNDRLPIDLSAGCNRCPIGCTAVALSQIIRYMHYHLGKPTGLYHNIQITAPTINGKTQNIGFYRSNYVSNSNRWDAMATDSLTGNISYVQDLMMDVGNRLGMKYASGGSFSNPSTTAMGYYSLTFSTSSYNYQSVINDLQNNKPVVTSAKYKNPQTGNISGHTWLIDGLAYRIRYFTIYKHFEYTENWMHESEYFDTFDELRTKYHINSAFDYLEFKDSDSSAYLLMNWGYDGDGNDGYYSTYPSSEWHYGVDFKYDKTIYYDFK